MSGSYRSNNRNVAPLKLDDFERDGALFQCKVCPSESVASPNPWLSSKNLGRHVSTNKHQKHSKERAEEESALRRRRARDLEAAAAGGSSAHEPMNIDDETVPMDCDDISSEKGASHAAHIPVQPDAIPGMRLVDESGRKIFFSGGEDLFDPLAHSFAQVVDGLSGEPIWPDGVEKPMADVFSEGWSDDSDDEFDMVDGALSAEDSASGQELYERWFHDSRKDEWFPYPDKATFLTDVLFHAPRLRFSRAQQKAILSWAKELGASVPSYYAYRKCETTLKQELGDPTRKETSAHGNIWYLNEIGDSVAQDIASPISRPDMMFYPEYIDNAVKELSNGSKLLRDVPDDLLSPSLKLNGKIYYVGELVKRTQDRWFIPTRWFRRNGEMWAMGHSMIDTPDGLVQNSSDRLAGVPVSTFMANIEDILNQTSGIYPFAPASQELANQMPHPLRAVAGSRPVYSIPLIIFIDDVSGNKSKQWNKHWACYMSNGSLPREKVLQEFHVRFVATSPHATPLEIMQGVKASIERNFDKPHVAYDCVEQEECLFRTFPVFWAGDNPMQAELCSGHGLNANCFCRTCTVGGTQEYKRSDEGFNKIFIEGEPRHAANTREHVLQQLVTALEPNVITALDEAPKSSGIKDPVAQPIIESIVRLGQQLRKASPNQAAYTPDEVQSILIEELKKAYTKGPVMNPLLDMNGVDIHQDTPTEILHTVLLGVVKYFWSQTMWLLDKDKKIPLFQSRLNSIVEDGLNIPKIPADYMCQYRGGLIGKHFKTISQVMAFTVYDLVSKDVLDAWLLLGNLTVLLWYTEIQDLDQYLADLQECIDNFLNVTARCSPGILISKPKFHFLVHLPAFIRRFGPAVLFSTERFESYNAVFRAAAIHSNRAAPSRDIAWTFAGLDRVKHIVTGGFWWDLKSKSWTRASPTLLYYMIGHPEHAQLLGLPMLKKANPGDITWYSKRDAKIQPPPILWHQSQASHIHGPAAAPLTNVNSLFQEARDVIAVDLDKVKCGDHVIVRSEGGAFSPLCFGNILEILVEKNSEQSSPPKVWISVQLFVINSMFHPIMGMPTLSKSQSYVLLHFEDIICAVNLQHDCFHGDCQATQLQYLMQERTLTSRSRHIIEHKDDTQFIINMHALHNHRTILEALPETLRKRSFNIDDVAQLRSDAAAELRSKKEKQMEAKKKSLIAKISSRANIPSKVQPIQILDTHFNFANEQNPFLEADRAIINDIQDDNQLVDVLAHTFINNTLETDATMPISHDESMNASSTTMSVTHDQSEVVTIPSAFKKTTVTVLKHFCRQEHIKQTGSKADISFRLANHYSSTKRPIPTTAEIEHVYNELRAQLLLTKAATSSNTHVAPIQSTADNQGLETAGIQDAFITDAGISSEVQSGGGPGGQDNVQTLNTKASRNGNEAVLRELLFVAK